MYGLVNQAVKDLVISKAGEDAWSDICETVGIGTSDFDPVSPYCDHLTYALVEQAAKKLQCSQEETLRQFGYHWVNFTAAHGYGEVMTLLGKYMRSCLRNLNQMHTHMGAMMPELKPPRFVVTDLSPSLITLHYYSTRSGLRPMVAGLLEALAQKFDERITIESHPKGTRSDHDEFDVRFE
jgi:hypothetical protein